MSTTETFAAVRVCSIAILAGEVLQADAVSAGNGMVVDWRTVKSGETLQEGADAFDTAQLFVALVGPDAALRSVASWVVEPAPLVRVQPTIHAYMQASNGGRRRTFDVGGFQIMVEPHEDDLAQAEFTAKLVAICAENFCS